MNTRQYLTSKFQLMLLSITFNEDETITVDLVDGNRYVCEIGSDDDYFVFVNPQRPNDVIQFEIPADLDEGDE